MNKLIQNKVSMHVLWGNDERRQGWEVVHALLIQSDSPVQDETQKPHIAWCEPTPQAKRIEEFPGLWIGYRTDELAELLDSVRPALDEARLFWKDRWVHLVIDPENVRWAVFQPVQENGVRGNPPWLKLLGEPVNMADPPWTGLREKQSALLLMGPRDLNRYGLRYLENVWHSDKANGNYPELTVKEYWQGSTLIGWNLEGKQ